MTKNWYVIDGENSTLWHGRDSDDCPQVFKSFASAEKRAKEAAECAPGTEFKIVGVEAIVSCGVLPPKTARLAGSR